MPHTRHPCTRTCSLETPPGSLLCGEPTALSQSGREVWILLIPLPRKVQTHPLYFYGDMHAAAAQVFLEEVEEADKLCSGYIPEIR